MEPLRMKLGKTEKEVQLNAIAYLRETYTYEQLTAPGCQWSLLKPYIRETGARLSLGDVIGIFMVIKGDDVLL